MLLTGKNKLLKVVKGLEVGQGPGVMSANWGRHWVTVFWHVWPPRGDGISSTHHNAIHHTHYLPLTLAFFILMKINTHNHVHSSLLFTLLQVCYLHHIQRREPDIVVLFGDFGRISRNPVVERSRGILESPRKHYFLPSQHRGCFQWESTCHFDSTSPRYPVFSGRLDYFLYTSLQYSVTFFSFEFLITVKIQKWQITLPTLETSPILIQEKQKEVIMNWITKEDVTDSKGPTGKFLPSIGRERGEVGMGVEFFHDVNALSGMTSKKGKVDKDLQKLNVVR